MLVTVWTYPCSQIDTGREVKCIWTDLEHKFTSHIQRQKILRRTNDLTQKVKYIHAKGCKERKMMHGPWLCRLDGHGWQNKKEHRVKSRP